MLRVDCPEIKYCEKGLIVPARGRRRRENIPRIASPRRDVAIRRGETPWGGLRRPAEPEEAKERKDPAQARQGIRKHEPRGEATGRTQFLRLLRTRIVSPGRDLAIRRGGTPHGGYL